MKNISRKDFVKNTGKVAISICAGLSISTLLQSCGQIKTVHAPVLDQVVRIEHSFIESERMLIIDNDELAAPLFVTASENGYIALLLLCTHKDCELNSTGQLFTCPCHGSQFDQSGKRLSGPAEKNLLSYKTEVKDGHLIIYLQHSIES